MKTKCISLLLLLAMLFGLAAPCMAANDTMATATAMSFGPRYSGTLSADETTHFYQLDLTESGRLTVSVNADVEYAYFYLYDASGKVLWSANPYWNSTSKLIVKDYEYDLTAGVYYFTVKRDNRNGSFSLSASFSSAGESFAETGYGTDNGISSANSAAFDKTYTGQLAMNDELDYYVVTLPSSGHLSITCNAGVEYVYYYLYDGGANQLWYSNPYWNSTSHLITSNLGFDLTAGTYYFAVKRDGSRTGTYTIVFGFEDAGETFGETGNGTDNEIAAANALEIGTTVSGMLALNDTLDYYKVTLPSSGRLDLSSTAHMEYIYFYLYDAGANQLWYSNPYWNSTSRQITVNYSIELLKGDYYIAVKKDGNRTGIYTLSAAFTSAEESFEETQTSNYDSMADAKPIVLGQQYRGQIAYNDGPDFYCFTVPEAAELSFFGAAEVKYIYYKIYDSDGKEIWKKNPYWNEQAKLSTFNGTVTLAAGTYYFSASRDNGNGNYTFRFSNGQKAVTGVAVTPAVLNLKPGETALLAAAVQPADAANIAVSWSSSSAAVAKVSAGGIVTAVADGTAVITVTTSDGGFTAQCTVNVGEDKPYNSSTWAKTELEKAEEMDLIPPALETEDLTRPITRAEFAAVAVRVYERLSGVQALPSVINPFADTDDLDVLKAYNLGTVNGMSANSYGPDLLLNREQCATMLTRVFKRVTMPGWTLDTDKRFHLEYTQPARFADDADISDYAWESVYFMVANHIINGIGNNTFAPKNTTTAQQAQGYANATREQALVIAVRMVENLG